MPVLELFVLPDRYALTLLPPGSPYPVWASGLFVGVIRSAEGVTVICEERAVPDGLKTQDGYRCLEIVGCFGLDAVGVLAAIAAPLAAAKVSLFAYSTWGTDYILIHQNGLTDAKAALLKAGHKLAETR